MKTKHDAFPQINTAEVASVEWFRCYRSPWISCEVNFQRQVLSPSTACAKLLEVITAFEEGRLSSY